METTKLKIEGMSCGHCVKSVTKALSDTPGVVSASVDLARGVAEIQHDGTVNESVLIAAVQEEGYAATSGE